MNSKSSGDNNLSRQEQALRERELQVRMRELEVEVLGESAPQSVHAEIQAPKQKKPRWLRRLIAIAQFGGIVIVVVIAVQLATWLAMAALVLGISWGAYKIFFQHDPS